MISAEFALRFLQENFIVLEEGRGDNHFSIKRFQNFFISNLYDIKKEYRMYFVNNILLPQITLDFCRNICLQYGILEEDDISSNNNSNEEGGEEEVCKFTITREQIYLEILNILRQLARNDKFSEEIHKVISLLRSRINLYISGYKNYYYASSECELVEYIDNFCYHRYNINPVNGLFHVKDTNYEEVNNTVIDFIRNNAKDLNSIVNYKRDFYILYEDLVKIRQTMMIRGDSSRFFDDDEAFIMLSERPQYTFLRILLTKVIPPNDLKTENIFTLIRTGYECLSTCYDTIVLFLHKL